MTLKRKIHSAVSRPHLNRSDWLSTARSTLIAGGIDSVKVDRLAKSLNVTRGGFYWHFKNRADLIIALLEHWENETNSMFESAIGNNHIDGESEIRALTRAWIEEDTYNPAYDAAVRDWARSSKRALEAVRRVDARRIEIIQRIFKDLGFDKKQAMIRARIMYFHQVGYYTIGMGESKSEREKLLPLYLSVFTNGKAT